MSNAFCRHCSQPLPFDERLHYCPALRSPVDSGVKPMQPLTEDDVRRIVRDELQRNLPTGAAQ